MATACEQCVLERWAELDDSAVVAAVDRCGACPRLADPFVVAVLDRLRRAVRARDEAERAHRSHAATLELLSAIASAANSATDARGMLRLCLPALCVAVGAVAGVVVIDGDSAVQHVARGDASGPLAGALARLAATAWVAGLAASPMPVGLDDDGGEDGDVLGPLRPAGVRRVLGVPVQVGGQVVACCVLLGESLVPGHEAVAAVAQVALAAQLDQVLARQRAIEAMTRALETAELASRAKSDFVASISHELRTPLSAILGYGELLAEEFGETGQSEAMGIINRMNGASRHLLGLINNVLDLSKIEAGKMEIVREPFDVDELVDDVVETLTPMVEDRGNRLLRSGTRVGPALLSDPTKLRQILFNLIGNAAKFTRMGAITVSVDLSVDPTRGPVLHLSVEDTGIGMNEAQLARIFEAFTQVEPTARFGGTGLGLTLCRRFADLLGGTIHVTSKPGVGSRFSVELPSPFAAASG
jgi:signal transduction histidine kinase